MLEGCGIEIYAAVMKPKHRTTPLLWPVFAILIALLPVATWAEGPATSLRPVLRPGSVPPPGAEDLLAKIGLSGEFGFVLYDMASGKIVEERNATKPVTPASVTKVITALYALDHLGADYRFSTQVLGTGTIENGTLHGDLILLGGGDPTLDTDRMLTLVRRLRDLGLRQISGRFLVNGASLPMFCEIDTQQPVYVGYNPAISGLNLNFNRVYFEWKRNASGYSTSMDARGEKIVPQIRSATIKIVDRAAPLFAVTNGNGVENWTVMKSALGNGGGRWLPVRDPNRYAADTFREIARSQGITLPTPEFSNTANGRLLVADTSAPLQDVMRDMLVHSTNLTAEVLGLAASQKAGVTVNSLRQSASHMTSWAQTRLGMMNSVFYDHSGLSDKTKVTARDLIAALTRARGIDTNFDQRLKTIRPRTAKGDLDPASPATILAKTGTLNFVSALSGYLTVPSGQNYAFAMFGQDLTKRRAADNVANELPAGAQSWNARARTLQQGLLYRWARLGDVTN